jgi:hypothetical protein
MVREVHYARRLTGREPHVLRGKLAAVTMAAIWGGLLGAVPASAGEPLEYPTFIQSYYATYVVTTSDVFHFKKFVGEIGSPVSECVPDRKVSLYRKRHGNKRKLGSDTTDAVGRWKIKVSSTNGKYVHKVKQKEIGPVETGEAIVCLGVKSDKLGLRPGDRGGGVLPPRRNRFARYK